MTERSLYWRRHLEAIEAEGISASAYARREGLTLGLLYQWRRKLNALAAGGVGQGDVPSGFVALRVTESLHTLPKEWKLRFNGVELSFPDQPDPSWVSALLLSLQHGQRHASRS